MSGDISDVELVARMAANAAREEESDRLAPFMHACAAIVRALGSDAPAMLEDLPGAVADVVSERNRMRRSVAGMLLVERDRMRSALLDILVVENVESAHLLADGALKGVTSELDEVLDEAEGRGRRGGP